MNKLVRTSALALLLSAVFLNAQETVDEASNATMRVEALAYSQIMRTLHVLTDLYGPRVTGTPNHEKAAKWAVSQMTEWGLKNGHLEPWDFGHPGC
jgi:carboxypeptidase Q